MKRKILLSALALCLGGAIWVGPAAAEAAEHKVRRGDTLSKLAARYGCPAETIRKANKLSGDTILIGQRLSIPDDCSAAGGAAGGTVVTHVVIPGDTLGGIAERYGVTVDHIKKMNRRKIGRRGIIKVNQKLKVRATKHVAERRKVRYKIQAGDTLSRIAARYDISVSDILRMNPRKKANRLRIGDRISLWIEGPEKRSAAVGRPQQGKLVDGEQLPRGAGWYRRRPHRSWGTNETVAALVDAFSAVRAKHPKSHDIAVGDLSSKNGGRLARHKSHQNGLDADIGFYFEGQPRKGPKAFISANRHRLDYDATWTLLMELIGSSPSRSKVEYLFIDYGVQRKLYNWAKKHNKASAKQLARMFQYPRGRRAMRGIIRHEPGHANHIHVRFKCARGDVACL